MSSLYHLYNFMCVYFNNVFYKQWLVIFYDNARLLLTMCKIFTELNIKIFARGKISLKMRSFDAYWLRPIHLYEHIRSP